MRTKSGTELREQDLHDLTEEAERGYDLGTARRRRVADVPRIEAPGPEHSAGSRRESTSAPANSSRLQGPE